MIISKNQALLAAVCISMFFNAFMANSINIAVPAIATHYNVAPQSVTWMINAFMCTTAPFLIGASALANRYGLRTIYSLGTLLATICSIIIPLCPVFYSIVAARAIQGIVFALIFCTAMALLVLNISKEKRGYAIGVATGAVYGGLSFAPVLGGFLTDHLGWQSIFYLTAIGQITSFLLISKVPKDKPITKYLSFTKISISFISGVLFLIGMSSFINDIRYIILVIAGIVLFIIYVLIEIKSKHQLLPIAILVNNSSLNYQLLASLLNYTANFAISFLLALHLELVQGYSATQAGIFLIAQPFIMMIFSSYTGRLSMYINKNILTIVGMLLLAIGLYMLTFIDTYTSLTLIIIAQVITGIGFGIFSAPNTNICMSLVDKSQLANVNALLAITRNLGMSFSMAILTAILYMYIDADVGTTTYIYELSYSINISFYLSMIICIVGMIFCILAAINYYNKIYKVRYLNKK